MSRVLSVLLLCLVACSAGATSPAPGNDAPSADASRDAGDSVSDAALIPYGRADWTDRCPVGTTCFAATHRFEGSQGSDTIDVACALTPRFGGREVLFRIARMMPGGNFETADEGVSVSGFVPDGSTDIRANGGFVARVTVRGLGWVVDTTSVGEGGACRVTVTNIEGAAFNAAIDCRAVDDDQTPARLRTIAGTFYFSGCAPSP